jgi:hypothetical protein
MIKQDLWTYEQGKCAPDVLMQFPAKSTPD